MCNIYNIYIYYYIFILGSVMITLVPVWFSHDNISASLASWFISLSTKNFHFTFLKGLLFYYVSNWPVNLVYSASSTGIFPVLSVPICLICRSWFTRHPTVAILLLSVFPALLHYSHQFLEVLYTNLWSFSTLFLLGISRDTSKIGRSDLLLLLCMPT